MKKQSSKTRSTDATVSKTFRLTDDGVRLLHALSERLGMSMTHVVELALRELAYKWYRELLPGGKTNGDRKEEEKP